MTAVKSPQEWAEGLQADLDVLDAEAEKLRTALAGVTEEAGRYRKAIRQLVGVTQPPKPKAKPKASVSDKTLAAVEHALGEKGELASVIAKRAGYSVNPTKAALELLHQLGDARLTGKGRGGGKLYAKPVRLEAVA